MAIINDIYYNSALQGCLEGILTGRDFTSSTAADYATAVNSAEAFALQLDSIIAADALVTTGGAATQLAITTNTIAANEQHRAGLLQAISRAKFAGRRPSSATQADYTDEAAAVKGAWTQGLTKLVTP